MNDNLVPPVPQVEKSKDDFDKLLDTAQQNYFLPWENVDLPSKGLFYNNMPDGTIKVKPMGADVDKMLANQRLVGSGEIINKIIEACVQLPDNMTIDDLLIGDEYFLLYYLRGITHGNEYEFVSECPHCDVKSTYEYNLNDLQKTIKNPNPEFLVEPMQVRLPALSEKTKQEVSALIRLIRVADIRNMASSAKDKIVDPIRKAKARNKGTSDSGVKTVNSSELYNNSMHMQVVGFVVNGQKYMDNRKNQLIEMLQQKDTATIRVFIESVSPGIETSIEVTCQNKDCGKVYNINLPLSENFFRPS